MGDFDQLLGKKQGWRLLSSMRQQGINLIEVMVTIAIASVIFLLSMSSFQTMMAGTRTKAAAESIMNGLRFAKSEAIKRNAPMRFQLVSTLANNCVYSTNSALWVVTQTDQLATGDAESNCGKSSSDATNPIALKSPGGDFPTVQVDSNGASIVTFNTLGLVLPNMGGADSLTQIDVTSTVADATPWRVIISSGGSLKLCNAGDEIAAGSPLKCP